MSSVIEVEIPDTSMSEVVETVKLDNYADILVSKRTKQDIPTRSVTLPAVIDTGTVYSTIPEHVRRELDVLTIEKREAVFANGSCEIVDLAGPLRFAIMDRTCVEEALVVGDQVLIGQIVLEKMDLLVDCRNQCLIQNPKHPNGPAFRV